MRNNGLFSDDEVWFGVVRRFLGVEVPGRQQELLLAQVAWYPACKVASGIDPVLGVPVLDDKFQSTEESGSGNFWAVKDMVPINLTIAPHPTTERKVVVLHRQADFWKHA